MPGARRTRLVLATLGLCAAMLAVPTSASGEASAQPAPAARPLAGPPATAGYEDPVPVPFAGLVTPFSVAVDADGNLFASDSGNHRVVVLPAGGGEQFSMAAPQMGYSGGLALDGAGHVYVTDPDNDRVLKLSLNAVPAVVPFVGLGSPWGVAVGPDGSLYASDADHDRVVRLPAGGGPQVALGFTGLKTGDPGPVGLAVDSHGNVFVADTGNGRVLKLPVGGGPQVSFGSGLGGAPFALAVDGQDNLYVSDFDTGRVTKVLPAGGAGQVVLPGSTDPASPKAFGLAVGPDGSVYVADNTHNRILRVVPQVASPDATTLRVTTSPAVGAVISVDGVARDSWGLNWIPIEPGSHEVCFGPVPGFAAPACQTVVAAEAQITTVVGSYSQNGYVRVIASNLPASEPIWVGDAARNNYGVWVEAAPGRYSVCSAQPSISYPFGCGYTDVVAGQTSEYRLYYGNGPSSPAGLGHSRVSAQLGETGSLRVTTDPPVGSMITVDGKERNNWGLDWLTLPVGSHDVCFGPVPGKIAPACTTVQVTAGDTADVVGQYVAMGHLRVTTSPQVPSAILVDGAVANVFGVWTPKTVGPHQVCFQPVPGYATPACRTVDVTADVTATTTGTFTPAP